MPIRIGLNGFGRTARTFFRIVSESPSVELEVVAINVKSQSPEQAAYLLKYDSVYGRYSKDVLYNDKTIKIEGCEVPILQVSDPAEVPWFKFDVDIVVEATGKFRSFDKAAKHLASGGVKKVLITAPAKGDIPTIVFGVNDNIYNKKRYHIISAVSCTTNCLAPVALFYIKSLE